MLRLFYCFCLSLLIGCTSSSNNRFWWEENGKLKVLTTIAMIDDLVAQIGGDYVDSMPLIRGELDPHSYELVKGDDEKFLRANLIFYNGLGLEHTLSMRQNLEGNPKAVAVADPILQEDPSLILSIDSQYDPHVWMDVALWMRTVAPIVEGLSRADPAHADYYRQRGKTLYAQMEKTDQLIYQTLQQIPQEKRYLVTSHDAFHYFARHYLALPGESDWRERCAAPEGLAPDAQLSVGDIYKIIAHVEKYAIPVLFPESNVSRDALRKIVNASKEKGCPITFAQEPLFGDSMGGAASYIEMIEHNVAVISREFMVKR